MQAVICILVLYFSFASSEVFNTSANELEIVSLNETKVPTILLNASEHSGPAFFEVYHKISEGIVKIENISDIAEDDLFWLLDVNSTEVTGIDADGCDWSLRKQLEADCDNNYDRVSYEARDIENKTEKTEALCCAVEEYEKCNLRAFDKANCGKDKEAIKDNMKAARMFITVIADVTCSTYRAPCGVFNTSAIEFDRPESLDETTVPSILSNAADPSGSSMLEIYDTIPDEMVSTENISEMAEDESAWLPEIDQMDVISTEVTGIDADGCDRSLHKQLGTYCDDNFDPISYEARDLEDPSEKTLFCCTIEKYENCHLKALDKANCGKDKAAVKENMKAARLFIQVITKVTCTPCNVFNTSAIEFEVPKSQNETTVPSILSNASDSSGSSMLEIYDTTPDEIVSTENISEIAEDESAWLLEIDQMDIISTEVTGIDADGCDISLRMQLEAACEDNFDSISYVSHDIKNRTEKTEALCCAVVEYEKCNLRAFDKANCGKDKEAIKDNMKAARIFIAIIHNVKCSTYRAPCNVFNTSAIEFEVPKSLNETTVPSILSNVSDSSGSSMLEIYDTIPDEIVSTENISEMAEDESAWLLEIDQMDIISTEAYGDLFYTSPSEFEVYDLLNETTVPSINSIASDSSVPPMFEVNHTISDELVDTENVSDKAEDDLYWIILTDPTEVP